MNTSANGSNNSGSPILKVAPSIQVEHEARVSLFFNRLKASIVQDFHGPLLTKCKRWLLASVCIATAVAFIVFGAFVSTNVDFWTSCRTSFGVFWLSFGVGIITSVMGIYWWLSKWEIDPASDPDAR